METDSGTDRENGNEAREVRLLLDKVYERCGYDFREYAPGTLIRRLKARLRREGLSSFSELSSRVLEDRNCLYRLINDMSITVSAMFRDSGFFQVLRSQVIPILTTYPYVRIWHAGCGLGEEIYSMAIVLQEEGLYDRCRIYVTDISEAALQNVRQGLFPLSRMREYTGNYLAAGGKIAFSDYYTAKYKHAIFRADLKKNLVVAKHNLVTDGPFNEFNLIVCRNVMIYFNKALKTKTHDLFYQSLVTLGFLALGREESISYSRYQTRYKTVDRLEKVFKKTG